MFRHVNVVPWLTAAGLGENDFAPRSPTMSMLVRVLAGGGVGAVGLGLEPPEPPQLQTATPTTIERATREERMGVSFAAEPPTRLIRASLVPEHWPPRSSSDGRGAALPSYRAGNP